MEPSRIINGGVMATAETYPLCSQYGKGSAAVAWLKLRVTSFTGPQIIYYVLEAERVGEFEGRENWLLFGVHNSRGEYVYDHFETGKLESLDKCGGLVRVEVVEGFTPCALADLPEVAAALANQGKFNRKTNNE